MPFSDLVHEENEILSIPVAGDAIAKGIGTAPSGAHAASGSWRTVQVRLDEIEDPSSEG
jgi:hypothetical protein